MKCATWLSVQVCLWYDDLTRVCVMSVFDWMIEQTDDSYDPAHFLHPLGRVAGVTDELLTVEDLHQRRTSSSSSWTLISIIDLCVVMNLALRFHCHHPSALHYDVINAPVQHVAVSIDSAEPAEQHASVTFTFCVCHCHHESSLVTWRNPVAARPDRTRGRETGWGRNGTQTQSKA